MQVIRECWTCAQNRSTKIDHKNLFMTYTTTLSTVYLKRQARFYRDHQENSAAGRGGVGDRDGDGDRGEDGGDKGNHYAERVQCCRMYMWVFVCACTRAYVRVYHLVKLIQFNLCIISWNCNCRIRLRSATSKKTIQMQL